MQAVIPIRRLQYALIEAVYSRTRSERFVVGYTTMKSLREVIAAPRIVAYGFQSRTEAREFARCSEFSTTVAPQGCAAVLHEKSSVAPGALAIVRGS